MEPSNAKDLVFCYGTLLNPETRRMVIGRNSTTYSDTLENYRKSGLNILNEEGSEVSGATFWVTKEELKLLDQYENVAGGLYNRIKVTTKFGEKAWAYQLAK